MTQTQLVTLNGDCTVSHITRSHRTLVEAFACEGAVLVDLSQVEAIDVTLIQLIVSASKTAVRQNRAFSLRSVPDSLKDVMSSVGIKIKAESGQIYI